MAHDTASPGRDRQPRQGYLAVMSWVLVVLTALYFGGQAIDRLMHPERRRTATVMEEALDVIEREYVEEVPREQLFRAAMRGMVASLPDRWSDYLDPEEALRDTEQTEGAFVGIGVTISSPVIVRVLEGSPAAQAGVQAGDGIAGVDGDVVRSPTSARSARDLAELLAGKGAGPVELALLRAGAAGLVRVTVREPTPGPADEGPTPGPTDGAAEGALPIGFGMMMGGCLVQEVKTGGPAETAGVRVGDVIASVEGQDAHELSLQQLVVALRGRKGSRVRLTLRRPGVEKPVEADIRRAVIEIPLVKHEMFEEAAGWLAISGFDIDSAQQVRAALKEMGDAGMKMLILDLRDNYGGLVKQAAEVADMFLDEGIIYILKGRAEEPMETRRADADVAIGTDVPIVALVGDRTASAGEILAGALKANGRATLMGTRTLGKGTVLDVHPLPDGSKLFLAIAQYRLANGEAVEKQGIEPDVEVRQTFPPIPPEVLADPDLTAVHRWDREQRARADEAMRRRAVEYLKTHAAERETTE